MNFMFLFFFYICEKRKKDEYQEGTEWKCASQQKKAHTHMYIHKVIDEKKSQHQKTRDNVCVTISSSFNTHQ